ncbi:MAG: hypothetical protein M1836_004215 [Candelina mexicana]|nr:MAG: hypothetical protein M1836_004215 [Candelina mexicana]
MNQLTRQMQSKCRKVVCIGRNYADHITELQNVRPKQPFFFLKPPSSIVLQSASTRILRPHGVNLHYEVELALIIGKSVKSLQEDDEAGYAVGIDMTARNVQDEAKKKGLPWTIAKGFNTFLPMSNFIPKKAIPDPHSAHLWLSVNNEIRQSDSTERMLFQIPRILKDITNIMELQRGDIVLTGTPKGVGAVETGDVLRAGIRVDGKDVKKGKIVATVKDRRGGYVFSET